MKKHVFLTSLLAITMSCGAYAASDVNFAGDYTSNGKTVNVSAGVPDTTYEYTTSNGVQSNVAYNTAPDKTLFTYTDKDGKEQNLADGTPDQSAFTGTTTASGDIVTTQEIVSGATADRANYTYKNGAGDTVTLGDAAQDMTVKQTLSEFAGGIEIDVTNGAAMLDGAAVSTLNGEKYEFTLENGAKYTLTSDGTGVVNANGETPTINPGSELETLSAQAKAAYQADQTTLAQNITDTAANWATEQTNFAAADKVFTDDSATIAELDSRYQTLVDATELLGDATAAQQIATDAYNAGDELFKAAGAIYNAPIVDTIANGANDAIDSALADGGAIKTELDKKVNQADAEAIFAQKQQWVDETLGIESGEKDAVKNALNGENAGDATTFTDAINTLDGAVSANKTAIETNTADIATNKADISANKTAIETNAAAIGVNATSIAANTAAIADESNARIAGDAATLNAARAYADAQGALSLKAANDYTDSKVDTLEKELSAGIASAAAMSSVAVSGVSKGEVSVGGGYGSYNSQSAVAFGAAVGLTDNWSVNAAAGLADSNVTFRAGTNYKFKLF